MMRRFLCMAMLMATANLGWASRQQATVDQLRQAVASRLAAHNSDEDLARYLGGMQLTERLTQRSLDAMVAQEKPGPKTEVELDLLADESVFLEPPQAELPPQAVPAAASQQAMLNSAVQYVAVTFKGLPNFLATRMTRSFDDTPLNATHSGWSPSDTELHLAGTFDQVVTFREGREVSLRAVTTSGKDTRQGAEPPGLTSTGEFGPVLATVLRDVAKGKVKWSHWETAEAGAAAVFNYQVPEGSSHYEVNFCCVRSSADPSAFGTSPGRLDDHDNSYRGTPGYHGTITIDPETGTILRITIDPELKANGPIMRAAVEVVYGPVEIGGKTFTCPVRSIAISDAKSQLGGDMSDRTILRINEVMFTDYHRFGSTLQIVRNGTGE